MIFEIEDKLVTSEIFENNFVCDLSACKGECCVAGDSGAPVEKDEIPIMEHVLPIVKKYMMQKGIAQVEKDGVAVIDYDYEYVTPLIGKSGACAFVYFDKDDVAKCSIEAAYNAGEITFQKPISCHLYPIRLSKLTNYTAINYNRWHICKPACACGNKLEVPIYKFLRTPIERKFGKDFFKQLELAAAELEK